MAHSSGSASVYATSHGNCKRIFGATVLSKSQSSASHNATLFEHILTCSSNTQGCCHLVIRISWKININVSAYLLALCVISSNRGNLPISSQEHPFLRAWVEGYLVWRLWRLCVPINLMMPSLLLNSLPDQNSSRRILQYALFFAFWGISVQRGRKHPVILQWAAIGHSSVSRWITKLSSTKYCGSIAPMRNWSGASLSSLDILGPTQLTYYQGKGKKPKIGFQVFLLQAIRPTMWNWKEHRETSW